MAPVPCALVLVTLALVCSALTGVLADNVAHGTLTQLPTRCRGELSALWTSGYGGKAPVMVANATALLKAGAATGSSDLVVCNAACQTSCRTTIQTALDSAAGDVCPDTAMLRACFKVAHDQWSEFVDDCILFNTQLTSNYQKNTDLIKRQAAEAAGQTEAAAEAAAVAAGLSGTAYGCFPPIDSTDEFDDWVLYGQLTASS